MEWSWTRPTHSHLLPSGRRERSERPAALRCAQRLATEARHTSPGGLPSSPHTTSRTGAPDKVASAPAPNTTTTTSPRRRRGKRKPKKSAADQAADAQQLRAATTWTSVTRHGAAASDVPDYVEPDVATVATLNIAGGGSDAKAEMLAPALSTDGLYSRMAGYKVPTMLFMTELQNARNKGADLHGRFGGAGLATYWTQHVGLIVQREMLGHELHVTSAQCGRVLQVRFEWHGEQVCYTGVYAPAYTLGRARQRFYTQLQVPVDVTNQIVLGDFQHVTRKGVDCNNPNAANTGQVQWGQFVRAHTLQGFADAKDQDHADELWPTFQGPRHWWAEGNAVRRLDMIWTSRAVDIVDNSWRTMVPWGTLDHAMVSVRMVAPRQRPPPLPSDDAVVPMDLDVIASKEFQEACEGPIEKFKTDGDVRAEMDIFLDRCRDAHDACLRDRKQHKDAAAARKRVQCDVASLNASAAERAASKQQGPALDVGPHTQDGDDPATWSAQELETRRIDGGADEPDSARARQARVKSAWYLRMVSSIERAAQDVRDGDEIASSDYSHRNMAAMFKKVGVRAAPSTFPSMAPFTPVDDVQQLSEHMAELGDGGFRVGSNVSGWQGPDAPPPPSRGHRPHP